MTTPSSTKIIKESEIMRKRVVLLILIVALAFFTAVQPVMADDGMHGAPHEYAPYSFWNSAAVFIDEAAMDEAWQAVAEAAFAMGNTCYEGEAGAAAVKDFFADMFAADFAALAIGKNQTFTYYDDNGAIDAVCRYRYLGPETVTWMGYDMQWHKYKRIFCVPRPPRRTGTINSGLPGPRESSRCGTAQLI
jgi:hypothetical protein